MSWNVANRVGDATRRQGEFLARLDPRPDLILLQEVNRRSVDALCELAGMGWLHCAVDLRQAQPDDRPVRRRGVAIAGRTAAPSSLQLLEDVPLPERLLIATLPLAGQVVHLASYHAPPGVSWFEKKPQQAVRFARWLATLTGPAAFGADANTPLIDAIDLQQTRTHWHTGRRILRGAPGDDLLVGPAKVHPLEDVLRRWLDGHPEELDRLRVERPGGPLALSYRTGRRKVHPGTDRRFDSIWVSPQFEVDAVAYPYAECIAAGSDHAAVIADLTLPRTRQTSKTLLAAMAGSARPRAACRCRQRHLVQPAQHLSRRGAPTGEPKSRRRAGSVAAVIAATASAPGRHALQRPQAGVSALGHQQRQAHILLSQMSQSRVAQLV